jgi:hypothetical protein
VRRDGGGRLGGKREYGVRRRWRISPRMPAGTAESGDRFRQPWGTIRRGKEGEMERRLRATYSRGDASIEVGSKGIDGGERGYWERSPAAFSVRA